MHCCCFEVLLDLLAEKRAPFLSCVDDVCVCALRRSPFLFGPFSFLDLHHKRKVSAVSTRFYLAYHVCDESARLVGDGEEMA
jgi:hypothetical protein